MMQPDYAFHATAPLKQSHEELQAVVGRALVDRTFRNGLLNGHRRECLSEFALTTDEFIAASSVDADDLATFAAEVDRWISTKASRARKWVPMRHADQLAAAA